MWVCNTCPRTFASERACVQHMNALDHWAPTFTCDTCPLAFRSQQDCHQHMHTVGHWQNYCTECKRAFDTENNLRMVRPELSFCPLRLTEGRVLMGDSASQLSRSPWRCSYMSALQARLRNRERRLASLGDGLMSQRPRSQPRHHLSRSP